MLPIARSFTSALFLFLTVQPAVSAQAEASPDSEQTSESAPATQQEIQSLLATLRDPQARAALERQLELLLDASGSGESAKAAPEHEVTTITDAVSQEIDEAWQQVSTIPAERWLTDGLRSLAIVAAGWLIYILAIRAGRVIVNRTMPTDSDAPRGFIASTAPLLRTCIRLFVIFGILAALALTWGIDPRGLVGQGVFERAAETGFSVLVVGLLAFLSWHAISSIVAVVFDRVTGSQVSARRAQRVRTLEPLFVSIGRFVVGSLALLVLLAELGLEIGPLLAGAGVVGLAIGFGAQHLVRDLLNGIMIIIEDAASIGDVVEVAGHKGLVEAMNMRVIRLRDLSGVVHVVPFGEITTVMNFTKDFSYALVDAGVAYRENIGAVIAELEIVGKRIREDEEFSALILDDLEILGVDALADSAVVVRVRIRTQADARWQVERALRQRIKDRFDEVGIEIPYPHTTLYFGQNKDGSSAPGRIEVDQRKAVES